MSGYTVAHLEEIDEVDDGRCRWRPVRHHLGIMAFGVNAWSARDAGDRIIYEHDQSFESNEELHLVLRGRAVFELGGERLDAPTGTLVFVRPGTERAVVAEEPGTTIVVVGAAPGKAYQPDGWEIWAPLRPLYEAGQYAQVADRGREVIESNSQYAEPLYNLACCESLAGRTTNAVEHLRQAIDRSERLRAHAKDDSDFDPIRGEPAFKELIGAGGER
jgi:mannose-6-phosphate isomerase-like protein (cupin superfamily)